MTMYKQNGFCPASSFELGPEGTQFWEATSDILGDRIFFMIYGHDLDNLSEVSVVDALKYAENSLGIQVACAIVEMIQRCNYRTDDGRPIVIYDISDVVSMPIPIIEEKNGEWVYTGDHAKTKVFQDSRYIVVVKDNLEEVHLYLLKR